MTIQENLSRKTPDPQLGGIIKLALFAVGGQGGSVLTNWIEHVARSNGYAAQATSVAGVAQRTGATVYYVEMAPVGDGAVLPVFSLMPAAGDVDIMIAAEMMEAGRAIIRGFVTHDRTMLIASTHRALAVSEKMVPGDGIASSDEVMAAAGLASRRFIAADFDQLAIQNGSVISASLFGALAGSGALPFPREAFEEAIRESGKGVEGSLRAFAAGFEAAGKTAGADDGAAQKKRPAAPLRATGPDAALGEWEHLLARAGKLPAPVAEMAARGLRKVVDFQDPAYGKEYLDRLDAVVVKDDPAKGHALSVAAAKYIANAMAYDDVIRVADIKTRPGRMERIRKEMRAKDENLLQVTEFFHPRAQEIVGLFPANYGARTEANPKAMARLDRWFNRGRRLRTDSLPAFVMLYVLGGMRGWRRRTLRHRQEQEHLDRWLATAMGYRDRNYDLATEVIACRRLIKGYSDTHARGQSKFDRVLDTVAGISGREDAADWCRRLREAALQDEEGKALEGAIQTIRSFS